MELIGVLMDHMPTPVDWLLWSWGLVLWRFGACIISGMRYQLMAQLSLKTLRKNLIGENEYARMCRVKSEMNDRDN